MIHFQVVLACGCTTSGYIMCKDNRHNESTETGTDRSEIKVKNSDEQKTVAVSLMVSLAFIVRIIGTVTRKSSKKLKKVLQHKPQHN